MKNKYHVASKEDRTADGITFHSKKEMLAYVNTFRPLMRSGIQVEMQKPFILYAAAPDMGLWHPVEVSAYVADFCVHETDGTLRIYESKGFQTAESKRTEKWFHICYPHLRIVHI